MVAVYALLNRIYWLSEIGVQFNQNTSENIDEKKVQKGNLIIDELIKEINSYLESDYLIRNGKNENK